MTFRRVVVATDFSEASEQALAVAARWSQQLDTPLTVLHVYDPSPIGPSAASPLPSWPTEAGARAIEHEARERIAALGDGILAGVKYEVATHDHPRPALGAVEYVNDDDLLIVGTHGRTGVKRVLLGSVAEQIIRHAPCTVLAVRGTVDLDSFPKRMVVCTDFSDEAVPAVTAAATVARAFSIPAALLYVEHTDIWQEATDSANNDELEAARAKVDGALQSLHGRHLPPPVKTEFVVADHRPDGIVDHAKQTDVDLLVLATHGRTGIARLVLGSVTERVIRAAPCPVLVVRSAPQPS
jgi:nucleotide-binding universal stress UspA family protein